MFAAILSIIYKVMNVFTESTNSVTVDVQPTIFIPEIQEYPVKNELQIQTLMGMLRYTNKTFLLEFSIKYINTSQNLPVESDIRHELRADILLTKYIKKKTAGETYKESIHKPQEIALPVDGNMDIYGFKISINKGTFNRDFDKLQKGCQLISLYREYNTLLNVSAVLIADSIRRFRWFLGIKSYEKSEHVAFQFSIKTAASNPPFMDGPPQVVFTELFEVVFRADYRSATIRFVDPKDYHYTAKIPN